MIPRFLRLLLPLLAPALAFSAEPVRAPGFEHVRTVGEISEYTLQANGLQVLLMPEHSAPVLTFMVTYRVGSRNEVTGTTGATHLLEHLMFKGTERFQRSKGTGIDQILENAGAVYNATTWLDRTNYYENVASDLLETVVELEADRMRNLLLKESDRQPEMTVVRNEFERGENSPFSSLQKEIFAAAYIAHPYHHSTIGWRSDIERVPIEKLREFYDTFYWPDNATVSVIGDFNPEDALKIIQRFYGPIPRAPKPIPTVYTEEPEQTMQRRVGVKRVGQLGAVAIGFKIPPARHEDFPALAVLDAILTDGKNSRFYRALTDKNLTTSVNGSLGYNHDPSLHVFYASMAPGATHEQVEKGLMTEIERLKSDGVTDVEVSTAISKLLAASAFQRDGSFAIAGNLNESIAAGDWTLYYRVDEEIARVKAADVKRVAGMYLVEKSSTVGWFVPIAEQSGAAPDAEAAPASRSPADAEPGGPVYYRDPALARDPGTAPAIAPAVASAGVASFAKNTVRSDVAGIEVLLYPTGVRDVVTFRAALPAGAALAGDGNPSLPILAGSLLDSGTRKHDKFAISQMLESVGASLSFTAGNYMLTASGQCLSKDVPLVVSLLAEMLREPAYTPEEFEKGRKQLIGYYRRVLESTDSRASEAFGRTVYPAGHPNRPPSVTDMLAGLEAATLEQVKAFHAAHYGPEHMIFVAVGDLEPARVQTELEKAFAGWKGGVPVPRATRSANPESANDQVVFMADKTSVTVVLGQATGLKYSDPDSLALRVGTAILGDGFTGRLMASVRDQQGLTYGIEAGLASDTFTGGDWQIEATFGPSLLDKGVESTRAELQRWYEQGITPAELEARKTNLIGTFKVTLATTSGIANALLMNAHRGYNPDFLDRYPERIRALTLDQVNSAIKKYLDPKKMILVQAGTVPGAAQPR